MGQQSAANTFNGRPIPAYGGLKPVRYPGQEPNSINKVRKTKRFYWAYDRDTVNVTDNSSRLGSRSIAFCCSNLVAAGLIRISINHLCWRTASAVDAEKHGWVRGKDIPASDRFEEINFNRAKILCQHRSFGRILSVRPSTLRR